MKRPSGSRRVRKSCPLTAPNPAPKTRTVDSRVRTMETQRYAKLLSRTCGNNRNLRYFSPGGKKICRQNGPQHPANMWVLELGKNVRRAWRTIARGAANHGNPAVCKTSVAYLRKQAQLALFFARRQKILPTKRPPFWSPETDPKTGAKSSGHKQIKLRLNEWPPFWGPFLDSKTGAVWSAKFWSPGEK